MEIRRAAPKKKKSWPRYCLFAALALLVFAGIFYVIFCQSVNSEFARYEEYFGESFDELYSLPSVDSDVAESLIAQAKKAMKTIGTNDELGDLAVYCVDTEKYPNAAKVSVSLEAINGNISGNKGYLWVAYHREIFDADGNKIAAFGTKDTRVLSRWRVERISGRWSVTEVREKP